MSTPTTPGAGARLDRRRLGVPSIVFMIIAASAPLTAVAGGVPTSFAVSGSLGIPFGYLVLAAILLVFAIGYAAMSRFVQNAGAFYAYIAQGISRWMGIGSSLTALVCYNLMQIGIYAMFGFTIADWLSSRWGIDTPWWLWVFVGIVVVGILGVNRVDLSAKVLGVLVVLEFLVVIVFDVMAIGAQPEGVAAASLSPAALFAPGVGVVLAFGVAAFMGFESAAIYAEEAKDPARTIPRATYTAVIVSGLFYAFSSWAMTVGVGESQVVGQAQELGPGLVFAFFAQHGGAWVVDIAQLLFITSLFAALQSFHNAVARYFFALGREGVLPRWLGSVRASSHAPWAGSVTQTALAVLVTLAFVIGGLGSDDPLYPVLTMFTWLTNGGAFGLVLLMAIVAVAVIGFFRRDARGVGIIARLVAPAVAAVLLAVLFVLILVNWNLMLGQEETTVTTLLIPAIVILPGIGGAVWGVIMKHRDPELYERIGHSIEESPEMELLRD